MGQVISCFRSTVSCLGGKNERRTMRKQTDSIVRLQENGKVIIENFPDFGGTFESHSSSYDAPTVIEGNVHSDDTRRLTVSQSLESVRPSPKRVNWAFVKNKSPSSSPMKSPPRKTRYWRDNGSDEPDAAQAFDGKPLTPSIAVPRPAILLEINPISEDTSASRIPPPSTMEAMDRASHGPTMVGQSMEGMPKTPDVRACTAMSARFNASRQPQLEMLKIRNPALFAETMESVSNSMDAEPSTRHEFKDGN